MSQLQMHRRTVMYIETPTTEIERSDLALGTVAFLLWSKQQAKWPFEKR